MSFFIHSIEWPKQQIIVDTNVFYRHPIINEWMNEWIIHMYLPFTYEEKHISNWIDQWMNELTLFEFLKTWMDRILLLLLLLLRNRIRIRILFLHSFYSKKNDVDFQNKKKILIKQNNNDDDNICVLFLFLKQWN